jgi:hypothetical protein
MFVTITEAITNFKYKQAHQRAFNKLFYRTLEGGVIPKVDLDKELEKMGEELSLEDLAAKNLINMYKKLNK